jgi:hypothetical protein
LFALVDPLVLIGSPPDARAPHPLGSAGVLMVCATSEDILVSLFNEVGRSRALTDAESRLLEKIIRKCADQGTRRLWTQSEDRLLLQLTGKGWTARQISIRLERTRDAVHTRIKKLKARPEKAKGRGYGRQIRVRR